MQLLTVNHTTVYKYSQPVEFGEHRMMFRPRESHDLSLRQACLKISPVPVEVRWLHDVFDNSLAIATFDRSASELRFESTITLEHAEVPLPDYALEEYAKTYPFQYANDESLDLSRGLSHHYASHDVAAWTQAFLGTSGVTATVELLRTITVAIRDGFRYKRRGEKGIQSPTETLQRRHGSCRDFAVLMIEVARYLGLAARFVSGYIFVPDLQSTSMSGGGSTHAWMQVYLPGAGWVDFDPTNNIVGNRNLIRVAVAWDARQVVPLWGTFIGEPSSFLGMDVSVTVSEARESLPLDR